VEDSVTRNAPQRPFESPWGKGILRGERKKLGILLPEKKTIIGGAVK